MRRLSIALVLMILSVTACNGPAAPANPVTTAPPTGTPAPGPTATSAFIPTPTLDIVGTVVAAGQPQIIESYLSPDGQWHAKVEVYECVQVGEIDEGNMVEQLTLTRVSDGKQTTVDSQQLSCASGLGAYGLGGWFWSPDSRYFYYTDAREGVPDGGGSFCWGGILRRAGIPAFSAAQTGRCQLCQHPVGDSGPDKALWL